MSNLVVGFAALAVTVSACSSPGMSNRGGATGGAGAGGTITGGSGGSNGGSGGSDGGDAPTPDGSGGRSSDETDGGETDGSDADSSDAAAQGDAGGDVAARLVPWQIESPQTAPLVMGIYDQQEKVHCKFLPDEAGQLRCLPWGMGTFTETAVFTDAACT